MLMHGCKEGQCAACKSFVLEGEDIEHRQVLERSRCNDYEKDDGYTLLCRAHAVRPTSTIELHQLRRGNDPLRPADDHAGRCASNGSRS